MDRINADAYDEEVDLDAKALVREVQAAVQERWSVEPHTPKGAAMTVIALARLVVRTRRERDASRD